MFEKLSRFWALLHAGTEVANPKAWKNRQIATNALITLFAAILALCKVFGYDFGASNEDIEAIALGIVACVTVFNSILSVTTSKKVGMRLKSKNEDEPMQDYSA